MPDTEGWIKLHRKFTAWEWSQDPNMVALFIHLLIHANHKPKKWRGKMVERGQIITGLIALKKNTGISIQTLRTCLRRLEETGEINRQVTNQYSIITLCNYDTYQAIDKNDQQTTNKPSTSNQQTTNKPSTSNKNDKNLKNDKNTKEKITVVIKKKCLFKNSGVTPEHIQKAFSKTDDLLNADPRAYFNRLLDASEAKELMYTDWIAVARSWARRDLNEDKLILKKRDSSNKYGYQF